jgi:hypothetical protein
MSVFTVFFGIYLLHGSQTQEDIIYSIPIILFGIYGIFHVFKFKILISGQAIVIINNFTERHILFNEIRKVESYKGYFIVYGKSGRAKISNDLNNQIEAKKLIKTRIKDRLNEITITGEDTSFFTIDPEL